jgi:hypothetical protein
MSKDELKEAIKELFNDEEFVSKFSKSFTFNMIDYLLNDFQNQSRNIRAKAGSDELIISSICCCSINSGDRTNKQEA